MEVTTENNTSLKGVRHRNSLAGPRPNAHVALVEDEEHCPPLNPQHHDIKVPMLCTVLSFLFPPLGWVGFLLARKAPPASPRGTWAFRSVAAGSVLSVVYAYVAASLVAHFYPASDSSATELGCGYGGPCPLFDRQI